MISAGPADAVHRTGRPAPTLFAAALVATLVLLAGCGRGGIMVALAARDPEVRRHFSADGTALGFRKELLLPASCGRELGAGEDFVEVWRAEAKAGWVYYRFADGTVERIGYQRRGGAFVAALTEPVAVEAVDTSLGRTTLWDGREGDR